VGSDSHSRKERVWLWVAAALIAYVAHLGFTQAAQAGIRVLAVAGKVSAVTMVAIRFQGVAALALVVAGIKALLRRSWDVFQPGSARVQVNRAAAQTGQSLFGLLAAGELTGAMQSAMLVTLIPLASLSLASWRARQRTDQPGVPCRSWLGPLVYAVASALLSANAGTKGGSVALGVTYLACAAVANAALVHWTSDASRESLITSMIWQNGPAAVLTLVLWAPVVPAALHAQLRSVTSTEALILAAMVVCSSVQQVAMQVATRCAKRAGMAVVQLTSTRGAQVYVGALLDWVSLVRAPYPADVAAFVVVAIGLPIAWVTSHSRVRAKSVPPRS
jgi:hypothetical protein